jgi:regulator of nucleoside diphosphate kinase
MEPRITLSRQDLMEIRAIIGTKHDASQRAALLPLEEKIERALLVDSTEMPSDVVALDARVLVHDLGSSICEGYVVVSPALTNEEDGYISVLAPLGMALLGLRCGDTAEVATSLGPRQLAIEAVMQSDRIPSGPPPRPREPAYA